ncbi:uncharacterized protein LOC143357680 [Halictus rubicundus]|uniref:uncharacterized protein LOC143357680 n=1 Tax=Halictus rubicundus TaxID=77578 RepID=UPI00403679EA
MDDTLDPIRASCNLNSQDEMSYLFGRDPSILAYGQRPCISKDTKKNLMSVYEIEESNFVEESGCTNSESQRFQTIKVYLRMKPFPKKVKLTQEQQEAYHIQNSTTLLTKLPCLDNNTSCYKRSNSTDIVRRKFTFTHTFPPETTQLELFEQAVKQHMIDFLDGQNSTIMTYGTTNSGKSYTLQGTITSPGIIPRCLEFVFSNISPKSTPSYKPVNHCDVVCLGPLERAQELEMKTKLLTFASMDKHQYINAYKEMQKLLQEESPIRPSQCIDVHYSVWVSFAEIYNEVVYDLLSNENQKKRTPLKLVTDTQGTAFIKGLKTVCVNSGSEAYQVLMAGQYNLKVAATALNARSSRSHCIFTIKLLKYYVENETDTVEVSTFAFCDLAGSERLKKTLNIGDRLKEAQNINTSLLVLGRCLKTIHDGQLSKQKIEHVGPFRESKLTRLFQKALSGKEHVALIVNINPLPNLYIETQNVLNFSAIAKKIVLEQKQTQKEHRKKSRFSQIVTESIKTVTDWDATELESGDWHTTGENHMSNYIQVEDYHEILSENKRLKDEIKLLKSTALSRDLEIREEMADTYKTMMKDFETEWKNHIHDVEEQHEDMLQWSVKQIEDFYKQKLQQHTCHKRRRSSIMEENVDDRKNVDELEIKNSHLESKLVLLKSSVKEIKESNQALTVEKNKLTFELDLTKKELSNMKDLLHAAQKDVCTDEETTCYVEELKSQLLARQEQVKKLKLFLNEAKEEYISVTTKEREKDYIIKEQEEELLEKQEIIDDLEGDLVNVNICLTKKTKEVDTLEEKLENENKQLLDYKCKMQDMLEQINTLENEKSKLLAEVQVLEKLASIKESTEDSECKKDVLERSYDSPKDEKYQEIAIKEEVCIDHEVKSLDKSTEIDNNHLTIDVDPRMKEKITWVESENSALKEKLTQSMTTIQSLKEELDVAKVKLKDISDQINNLQINGAQTEAESKGPVHRKIEAETAEIGCQVNVESNEKQKEEPEQEEINENEFHNKSSQTIESTTNEENTQTSFDGESDESALILDELSKLTVKYDDLKAQYKEKCQMLDDLEQGASILRQKLENLSEESNTNKILVEEYKQSITEYEQHLNEAKTEISRVKDDYNQCTEKLNALQAEFDKHVSECKNEHTETINRLTKDLNMAIEKSDIKTKCLDVHAAKIMELEHNLDAVTELQQQIEELNKNLEICQDEKEHLQKLLDENNDKLLEFEDRLESAKDIEQEKDNEIISLQREMKCMIQRNNGDDKSDNMIQRNDSDGRRDNMVRRNDADNKSDNMVERNDADDRSDKLMEAEMKNTIRELTEIKEKLSQKEEYIEHLETHIKTSEQNAKIMELLQQSSQERQAENDRLRNVNQELKNSLIEMEREMEAFMKNRDKMVTKYETLVKNQQEELEKQKRVATTSQSKKGYCENTSEDEAISKERRTRRAPRKYSPTQDDASVIELPTSEPKRNAKRAVLPPPSETLSERRRNTRRKKLYLADESLQDILPLENTTSTPSESKTRTLRTRRR